MKQLGLRIMPVAAAVNPHNSPIGGRQLGLPGRLSTPAPLNAESTKRRIPTSRIPHGIFALLASLTLIGYAVLLCSCAKGPRVAKNTAFDQALRRSEMASEQDQLLAVFPNGRQFHVSGKEVSEVSRAQMSDSGTVVVVDYRRRRVSEFDLAGRLIRSYGTRGSSPGEYLWPSGVAILPDTTISISDLKLQRVNNYGPTGLYNHSFSHPFQPFSAGDIIYEPIHKEFWLTGNRWVNGASSPPLLLHRFKASGDFLDDAFEPPVLPGLDMTGYDDPLITHDYRGSVYVCVTYFNTIYASIDHGQLLPLALRAPVAFRPPADIINAKPKTDHEAYELFYNWQLAWTPIAGLAATPDALVVEYQTFSPLRYLVVVYSLPDLAVVRSFNTNAKVVASGPNGELLFDRNRDSQGEAHELFIATL